MQTVKCELRKAFRAKRAAILNKQEKDQSICSGFLETQLYKNASTILCYASSGSEIDTLPIIRRTLSDGKRLALPRCSDENGNMDFYIVNHLSQLVKGAFGISEPDPAQCEKADGFDNAVCVVPGLSFDRRGYRLGYGKGYYDRFLEKFTFITIGLCYNELLSDVRPTDPFDVPVDYIVLQNSVIKV